MLNFCSNSAFYGQKWACFHGNVVRFALIFMIMMCGVGMGVVGPTPPPDALYFAPPIIKMSQTGALWHEKHYLCGKIIGCPSKSAPANSNDDANSCPTRNVPQPV